MIVRVQPDLEEVKQLFLLLEDLNHFFHQPTHYEDIEQVRRYADEVYPKLRAMYYDVVWNWLPPDVRQEMIDRPSPFAE